MVERLEIDRRERARSLLIAAAVAVLFSVADSVFASESMTTVHWVRGCWAAGFIIGAIATLRGPKSLLSPVAVTMGVGSVLVLAALVHLTGDWTSPSIGWFIGFPFLAAVIVPEDPVVVGATAFANVPALAAVLWLAPISLGAGAIWIVSVIAAGALALHSSLRYVKQRRAELRAEWERSQSQAALELSEARRKDGERLRHVQQLATIGGLTAGVTHELRTPLTILTGCAQLLERHVADDAEAKDLLKEMLPTRRAGPRWMRPAARCPVSSTRRCDSAGSPGGASARPKWRSHRG